MSERAHPRDLVDIQGVAAQDAAFDAALQRGRLHHAWLLTGPPGLGKAAFAYRAARKLLGQGSDRLIAASSHPDFMVLERETEGGATRRNISVDQARRLPEFFAKAPALGPYRVALIDTADDLNVNAANAVLKTLEEPSGRGVLFLVSNAPGRLLPTIRSRCRRLTFEAWSTETLVGWLEESQGLQSDDAHRLAVQAQGSPGRALGLIDAPAGASGTALDLLDRLPDVDAAAVQALAEGLRGAAGAERFATLVRAWAGRVHAAALAADSGQGAVWAALWSRLNGLPERVEGLNLDRADALWTLVGEFRAAARETGRPC
jgi:DNA polymerase-3 subunit delta'